MRSVTVIEIKPGVYRIDFYDSTGTKVGHWPTDGLWLSKFIQDWLVDGIRPQ